MLQVFGAGAYTPLIIATGLATLAAIGVTYTLKSHGRDTESKQKFNSFAHLKQSLGLVKKSRTIFALAVAGLLTLNGEYFLRQSYQPFFQDMAVPSLFLGIALSAGKLLNFVVIRHSYIFEKFLTVDRIILWLNLALGGLFIAFSIARSPWALVPIFILMQGLLNAERPVVSDYINQRIESQQRSTVLSAVSFIQNLGQIFARLALAVSIGLIGIGTTYIAQGIYLIIGAIIGVWYLRRCGCVHRVKSSGSDNEDLQIAQEIA